MAYKLELHIVVIGDTLFLKMIERSIREYITRMSETVSVEYEIAGGLVEEDEDHGEENSESLPNGE